MNRMKPERLERKNPTSRPARRAAACAAAVGLLSPVAVQTAQASPRYAVPVGSWQAQVTREGAAYEVQLSFRPDRTVCLVSPAGASEGGWSRAGAGTFACRIRETWHDEGGAVTGWVDIAQDATRKGASFTSAGVSTVHRPDGSVDSSVPVRISAVRTGPPDPAACA
ncbi:hypothetical protein [Streptomyces clavifer]|uniref:hypothetical protein n=1 Tax=Streptomyces clavifer TaxID=68188 RepID=UPI0036C4BF03